MSHSHLSKFLNHTFSILTRNNSSIDLDLDLVAELKYVNYLELDLYY